MSLGSLPSWLQISPSDYLRATQAGVQAGHAIAESTQRAWEEQERMKMAADQHAAQLSQQAIENAAQRLAADRLEQYRQQEVEARKQQLGIEQKRLGSLDIQQQRADDLAKHYANMEEAKMRQDERLQTGKQYGEPVFADIPGVPGAKITYRPGSPGSHVIIPPRSGGLLTPNVAASVLRNLPEIERNMKMSGTNSMTYKYGPQLLNSALGGMAAPVPKQGTGSSFKILSVRKRDDTGPASGTEQPTVDSTDDTEE